MSQFREVPDLTFANFVNGVVQIGDTVVHVVAVAGVREVLLRSVNEGVPHVRAYGLHTCPLLFSESLGAQILNTFPGAPALYSEDISCISVIEHTHILMPSSD